MRRTNEPTAESVKVLLNTDRRHAADGKITSSAAKRFVARNCVVVPLEILDPPEPIKKPRR